MSLFLLKRLALIPVSLLLVVTLSFALLALIPGDPAYVIAGPFPSDEDVAIVQQELGLDQPVWVQFKTYLANVAQGDFGRSLYTQRPVVEDILRLAPNTIELIIPSIILAMVLGIGIGIMAAYYGDRSYGRLARGVTGVIQSTPDFVMALLLIYVFFFLMGVAPAPVGRTGLGDVTLLRWTGFPLVDALLTGQWATAGVLLRHMVLPVLTIGIVYSAYFARTTRATMGAALRSPQVEFARANGLSERRVVWYAFLDARTPIVTYSVILLAAMSGGVIIVETVFAWPGIGRWGLDSIVELDIPAAQGFIVVTGAITLTLYILLDLLTRYLDPRVKYE